MLFACIILYSLAPRSYSIYTYVRSFHMVARVMEALFSSLVVPHSVLWTPVTLYLWVLSLYHLQSALSQLSEYFHFGILCLKLFFWITFLFLCYNSLSHFLCPFILEIFLQLFLFNLCEFQHLSLGGSWFPLTASPAVIECESTFLFLGVSCIFSSNVDMLNSTSLRICIFFSCRQFTCQTPKCEH